MKYNLGCGSQNLKGFVNVDNNPACNPDLLVDLEQTPWPFENNTADEIVLSHVLEHLGQTTDSFRMIIQELYRMAKPNAKVLIAVPDPAHDNFWGDPTHVRAITPQLLAVLSRDHLAPNIRGGYADTPIAFMWNVDFKTVDVNARVSDKFKKFADAQNIDLSYDNLRFYRNSISDYAITLQVIKPLRKLEEI